MIERHEFNSSWWGSDTGILTDSSFFKLNLEEQRKYLTPYDWVEFRCLYSKVRNFSEIVRAGFFQVDIQCRYRLDLNKVKNNPNLNMLEVIPASDKIFEFDVSKIKGFDYERYHTLENVTSNLVNNRYINWSKKLISRFPKLCLEIKYESKVQGWILAEEIEDILNMNLGIMRLDSTISGLIMYRKAILTYAQMGYRVCEASFSVNNHIVHNIHANLGARFLEPELFWFWIA